MTAAVTASRLPELLALAREPSSDRRRELLRQVTDVFLGPAAPAEPAAAELYGEVASRLAADLDEAIRAELSARLAHEARAPLRLVSDLAHDDAIAVAGPVLRHSPVLDEAALLSVARTKGQDHLRAVSSRPALPQSVSDVVVERGDDDTVVVLLQNSHAVLSRAAAETITERADAAPALHAPLVARRDLPPDLLNALYFAVESRLRYEILARNAEMAPAELDAALAAGRARLAGRSEPSQPCDYAAAAASARRLRDAGPITPAALAGLLRKGDRAVVEVLLAETLDVDFSVVRRIFDHGDLDALALLCRAAGFDRALFLTFAVAILQRDSDPMGRARAYARLYEDLTPEAANRTLRFWRTRLPLAA